MRWISFFILAYVALGVQLGLAGAADIQGAGVNVVMLAAIFIALNVPRDEALLGCFLLGLMQDLLTLQPLGVWAVAYTIVGMFVISTQEFVYREHPLTHITLGLGGGLLSGAVRWLHAWLYAAIHHQETATVSVKTVLLGAILSAAAAPVVLWALQRGRKLIVIRSKRLRAEAR